jgi:hypothetical protein
MATKKKNPAAVSLGSKGGNARWAGTTPEERSEAARKRVQARWAKAKKKAAKKARGEK